MFGQVCTLSLQGIFNSEALSLLLLNYLSNCFVRLTFIGRLDTWNTNWVEVEQLRSQFAQCNLEIRLWELFDSQLRQGVFGLEEDAVMQQVNQNHNRNGEEYVQ